MKFIWLTTGTILVSVFFLFFISNPDFWTATNTAGIAAFIYLFVLLIYSTRNPFLTRAKIISVIIFIIGPISVIRGMDGYGFNDTLAKSNIA